MHILLFKTCLRNDICFNLNILALTYYFVWFLYITICTFHVHSICLNVKECSVIFGTWSYTSYMVNLTNSSELVKLDDYNKSGEWHITTNSVSRLEFNYVCCPHMKFSKVRLGSAPSSFASRLVSISAIDDKIIIT